MSQTEQSRLETLPSQEVLEALELVTNKEKDRLIMKLAEFLLSLQDPSTIMTQLAVPPGAPANLVAALFLIKEQKKKEFPIKPKMSEQEGLKELVLLFLKSHNCQLAKKPAEITAFRQNDRYMAMTVHATPRNLANLDTALEESGSNVRVQECGNSSMQLDITVNGYKVHIKACITFLQ